MAALLTARVRWSASPPPHPLPPLTTRVLASDIAQGLRYVWQTDIIRWLTLIGAGASISGGGVLGLTIVVGVQQLGMATDDPRLGLLYSATALGAFLISLAVSQIQRRVPTGWITLTALTVTWVSQLVWAVTTSLPFALVVLAVLQAASTLTIMNGIIVRQSLASNHLQSRVNTTARLIAWGGTPVGAVLAGVLAQRFDTALAILVCSGGTAAALIIALRVRL